MGRSFASCMQAQQVETIAVSITWQDFVYGPPIVVNIQGDRGALSGIEYSSARCRLFVGSSFGGR